VALDPCFKVASAIAQLTDDPRVKPVTAFRASSKNLNRSNEWDRLQTSGRLVSVDA